MNSMPRYVVSLIAGLVLWMAASVPAVATDLSFQKLYGKWTTVLPTGFALGADINNGGADINTAALSPKWAVVGDAGASDHGNDLEGGVQVFNAATGAWVRKILPPTSVANQSFGAAVAISGDIALIGAYWTNSITGKAYTYNLATGAKLKEFSASDGAAGDGFGFTVAIIGNTAAIAAPGDDTIRGSVYLFNLTTGAQLTKLQASDGVDHDFFGDGLAAEGKILAVGADGNSSNRGAVYFYDLSDPAAPVLIKKYQPAASAAGDAVGYTVAMHEGKVVMGNFYTGKVFLHDLASPSLNVALTVAGSNTTFGHSVAIEGPIVAVSEATANGNRGRVHLFKSSDGSFIRTIDAPNSTAAQRFGYALALNGGTLLATAPDDSTQAVNAGAAHLIRPLTQPMRYTKVLAKGDFAPGAADISYGTIGDVFVNSFGEVTFTSSLTGAGSNGNKDVGVFSDLNGPGLTQLLHKTRSFFSPGVTYAASSRLAFADNDLVVGVSTLTGTGVTSLNNQVLWYQNGASSSFSVPIRTGTAFGSTNLIGTTPLSIVELVASNQSGMKQYAAVLTLRTGLGGVDATKDSAIYAESVTGSSFGFQEGAPTPAPLGCALGQIAPRIAYYYAQQIFSAALTGTGITAVNNAAIYKRTQTGATTLVVQKGDKVFGSNGSQLSGTAYTAFIGESGNGDDGVLYRASYSNPAASEGLWIADSSPSHHFVMGKGTIVAPGVTITKIINFWSMGSNLSSNQCLALVQLTGSGVNAANDQALLLWQRGTNSIITLLREGDPAPGCPGTTIGVISRVNADAWFSSYAVLATLTGAAAGTEQALFTGNVFARGNDTSQRILRSPFLRLRKGQLFDNQPGKVKSISLPSTNLAASGAGNTGRGRSISYSNTFAFVVEFDNGVRQIMNGFAN